ncbi:MAG: hypothetical protein KI792_00650 [Alphaproteobacteria bacterium]|nr:hypothetical protein [Alphaproteobacteria bacterium SS10]
MLERTPSVAKMVADTDGDFAPFFRNASLNHGIFLKHRLREDELEIFDGGRSVGTKIFAAFNADRLEEGGKYIFVDQRGAADVFHEHFGLGPETNPDDVVKDINLLRILDHLPSLDPFLLREKMRLEGYNPHMAYFDLNPAEYKQIRGFVEREFTPLAELAYEGQSEGGATSDESIQRLVDKMWDSRDVEAIRPLINSLQIKPEDAPEVLFAWKGFIYYKSNLGMVKQKFEGFQNRVKYMRITHFSSKDIEFQIEDMRSTTITGMKRELVEIQKTIAKYDHAYKSGLIRSRDPKAFRAFLDDAPKMFYDLGASIAAIKHAMSFWDFRFGTESKTNCTAEEFLDIMNDFRKGLRPEFLKQEEAA